MIDDRSKAIMVLYGMVEARNENVRKMRSSNAENMEFGRSCERRRSATILSPYQILRSSQYSKNSTTNNNTTTKHNNTLEPWGPLNPLSSSTLQEASLKKRTFQVSSKWRSLMKTKVRRKSSSVMYDVCRFFASRTYTAHGEYLSPTMTLVHIHRNRRCS